MSSVVEELDSVLKRVDSRMAQRIERLVRDLIAVIDVLPNQKVESKGRSEGYFERIPGCLAEEEFERPVQLPYEKREEWVTPFTTAVRRWCWSCSLGSHTGCS